MTACCHADTTITMMPTASCSKTLSSVGGRTIGYAVAEAASEAHRKTAILYFYPLSGSSRIIDYMEPSLKSNLKCNYVCVDRPSVGSTSMLLKSDHEEGDTKNMLSFDTQRILGHAQDVLKVVHHLGLERVYILGVCIGHPYAVQVCRELQKQEKIKIMGLTLVAPFVSPACPHSWWVARMGASVPSLVVTGFSKLMMGSGRILMPFFLTPSGLRKLMSEEEWEAGGWTEEDSKQVCDMVPLMSKLSGGSNPTEALLGSSKGWQFEILDKFATETGIGLKEADDQGRAGEATAAASSSTSTKPTASTLDFPIRIHASAQDKLTSLDSVKWVAERCYGWDGTLLETSAADWPMPNDIRTQVILENKIHSHEVMTFLGGPPRNPILLYKIAKVWDLMD